MNQFWKITQPLTIGNVILKSHIYSSCALPHYLQGPETYPSDAMMAFFSSVAKNGAAMIPLDECGGYPEMRFQGGGMPDAAHMPMFDMRDPSVQNKLSELAEELHFLGTKLLLKTELTYPEGYSLHGGEIFEFLKGTTRQTRPIPEEKMQEMVDQFVKKVSLYRSLGYDGLTIRTDGYVGWQPKERQDAYGGSVTNRTRLLHRCLSAVKQALGQDFLIEAVMAGELPLGYGGDFDAQVDALGNKIRTAQPKGSYQLEDTLEFLRAFDGIVDVLQLREHDAFLAQPTTYNYTGTPGTVSCAKAIRQSGFRGIIALNGGFQAPGQIEQLLESGVCDMIAMGRAFYADPDYYEKIRQDRAQDIVPCIKCNRCHGLVRAPWISVCSVNPTLGMQHKLERLVAPTTKKKRVAVIGGGPAGMEAAMVAAKRGHSVTLYEKEIHLGGQLRHADYFSFKWLLKDYRLWLERQLKAWKVEIHTGVALTPAQLKEAHYDCVISAVGSRHIVPGICKNMTGTFRTCWDIIGHEDRLGARIALLGGSHTGTETAMYLAEHGHTVYVFTRQDVIAKDAPPLHNIGMDHVGVDKSGMVRTFASWENYARIIPVTNVHYEAVTEKSVTYRIGDGPDITGEFDDVIISGGVVSETAAAMQYADCAPEFYAVGDCNGTRNLQTCTRDAFAKASQI